MESVYLGQTGVEVSVVGFGSYRIRESMPEHKQALKLALENGCNLIDTSSNYTDGSSEKLVGQVVSELSSENREKVVLVTKIGFNDGRASFSELNLREELSESSRRLQTQCIDIVLLHKPEYLLKEGMNQDAYYQTLSEALKFLQKQVEEKKIRFYGISCNSFIDPENSPEYTSLDVLQTIVTENSLFGFAVIEFPLNLLEQNAALLPNHAGCPLLDFARNHGIGTLINRPLNAFFGDRIFRLSGFSAHHGKDVAMNLKTTFQKAMELEGRIFELYPTEKIALAHIIQKDFDSLKDPVLWKEILDYRALPSLTKALDTLKKLSNEQLAEEYEKTMHVFFEALTWYLESQAAAESRAITLALTKAAPELKTSPTLSQKAIRVVRSIPGVDCVLVGMRQPTYVKDALQVEQRLSPEKAFASLRAAKAVADTLATARQ